MLIGFWLENLKERSLFECPGIGGMILLKMDHKEIELDDVD